MEDYALLLEGIIYEMGLIADGKSDSCVKLAKYIESAKQYLDAPNKAALTRAYNTARRYIKYKGEIPADVSIYDVCKYGKSDKYLASLRRAIRAVANRYMLFVLNVV